MAELLDIKGPPKFYRTRRWTLGLPQYELGHSKRVAVLDSIADRVPGLFITGNFLHGISVANCLSSANETALGVVRSLTSQTQAASLQSA